MNVRRSPERGRPSAAPRREVGAVLLEFAVVAPFFVVLAFGMVEFGFGYRSNVVVSNASASAARNVAQSGSQDLSDYWMLEGLEASLAELPDQATIVKIIVFDPDQAGWTAGTCRSKAIPASGHAGVSNACNIYAGSLLGSLPQSEFTSTDDTNCTPANWDRFFCPNRRDDDPLGGLGQIGVYVEIELETQTGLFPFRSVTIDETVIMRIEPEPPE